jgi:hypothetical protein
MTTINNSTIKFSFIGTTRHMKTLNKHYYSRHSQKTKLSSTKISFYKSIFCNASICVQNSADAICFIF